MKTKEEIERKIEEIQKKESYLQEYLSTIYKNNNPKERISAELTFLSRERNALQWVIGTDLPF